MKRILFAAALSVLAFAAGAAAQEKPADYSGTWVLDVSRSKLTMPVDSMTMTVSQSEKEISITTETKRPAPPEGQRPGGGGMGGGRGPGGGRGLMGGDGTTTYSLEKKETSMNIDGPMGSIPVYLKAKAKNGKLELSRNAVFNGPMGEVSMGSKEVWEMSGWHDPDRESRDHHNAGDQLVNSRLYEEIGRDLGVQA